MYNNEVLTVTQNIKLNAINKPKNVFNVSWISNPNIGVIDTETYTCSDSSKKIFTLGFKTNLKEEPIIYYINDKDLDSNKIVLSLINELLRPKYENIKFYCHNLANNDIVFILSVLYDYNDSNNDKYKSYFKKWWNNYNYY